MDTLDNPRLQDPSTVPYRHVALRYGGLAGLILIVVGLLMNLTGMVDMTKQGGAGNWISNILTWGILVAAIVMAMIKHRDTDLGGYMSYGRAFMVGFSTILVIALITLVWSYIYFAFIDPDIMVTMKDASMEQMMNQQGMDEEGAEAAMGMMGFMFTPFGISVMASVGTIFIGLIFSLIAAAFTKRDAPANV